MVIRILATLYLVIGMLQAGIAQNGLVNDIALRDTLRLRELTGAEINAVPYKNTTKPEFHFNMFSVTLQNNSKLPYGSNDGSLFPSVGMAQQYSLGVSAKWGRFSLRLQPELIVAANKSPDGLPDGFYAPNYWYRYYEKVVNVIDLPETFGTSTTTHLYPGQSSFKYETSHLAFGLSTENLWWGPGLYNSLVMTNNAPGFPHLTVNTTKPWVTPIGSFEGQIIVGRLNSSGVEPMENGNPNAVIFYSPKPDKERLLTGMILTWQPKWTKNLSIGFAHSAYLYEEDVQGVDDVLPFSNYWQKSGRPALGSLFFRYAMPADHAEIYFEYGRADKPASPWNILADSVPSGYVGGLRKLISLGGKKGFIAFTGEVSYQQMPDSRLIWIQTDPALPSKTSSWYTNGTVRQGYTNHGQVIGSSVGAGSNSQILDLSWIKGPNKIGFQFERILHNNDYYYYNYFNGLVYPGPNFLYWTDVNIALHARWTFKNFIVAAQVKSMSALNYKWVKFGSGGLWDPAPLSDKRNLLVNFSVLYHIGGKK